MENKTTLNEVADMGKEWNQLKVPSRLRDIESRFCYTDIWKFLHFKGIDEFASLSPADGFSQPASLLP